LRIRSNAAGGGGKTKAASIILVIMALPFLSLYTMSLAMPTAHAQAKPDLDTLAKEFYCTCGCNYLLETCETQMTCDVAKSMKAEIASMIQSGMNSNDIINAMTSKYGNTVLATPKAEGFNLALWWYPAAGGLVGIIVIAFLARKRSNGNWRIDPDEVLALDEDELLRQIDIDKSSAESSTGNKYDNMLRAKITGKKPDNAVNEKVSGKKYDDMVKEKTAEKKYADMLKDKRKTSKSKSKSKKEE
jgi:cytochrome c-type biogenesis protein CcmH/NrfF